MKIKYIFRKKLFVPLRQQYRMTIEDKLWSIGGAVKQDQDHLKESSKNSRKLRRYHSYDDGRTTSMELDRLLERKKRKMHQDSKFPSIPSQNIQTICYYISKDDKICYEKILTSLL
ncbi:PREDICTED: uncharacterized protein LOC106751733 isoform X2 [Dinoponera quadriceps]|uniref:Uncharacterized protein LOC106751733 isoform X2 n=1 Tax=Dinoponera quadriceps TaxID=609295 RepID=A0A6P3YEE7_DINQU|nr:PREDICTED: uncharacterized protein LOC106751733 isoform X2 [Dinoponera quadriceps]